MLPWNAFVPHVGEGREPERHRGLIGGGLGGVSQKYHITTPRGEGGSGEGRQEAESSQGQKHQGPSFSPSSLPLQTTRGEPSLLLRSSCPLCPPHPAALLFPSLCWYTPCSGEFQDRGGRESSHTSPEGESSSGHCFLFPSSSRLLSEVL